MESLSNIRGYYGKYIHCIKDYKDTLGDEKLFKGKFYELKVVSFLKGGKINSIKVKYLLDDGYISIIYFRQEEFLEYFELRTFVDIRKDKIKSILDA